MGTLTDRHRAVLRALSKYHEGATVKWAGLYDLTVFPQPTPQFMGALVRRGLVRSTTQTERPLHEGAIRYGWYQITEAGRTALTPTVRKETP